MMSIQYFKFIPAIMRRRKSKELDYCRLYAVGITIIFGVLIILVYILDPHHAGNKSLLMEARERSFRGRFNANIKNLSIVALNDKPIVVDSIVPTIIEVYM
jgi:preprotein translocase subunit SecY